jgi:hypothetical protein
MSGAWEYLATALDMIKCISNAIYVSWSCRYGTFFAFNF